MPNTTYSGSPKPRLDEVKFLPFTSDSAEFNVLKAGGTIDVGYIPPRTCRPRRRVPHVPTTNPLGSGYYLAPNYYWSVNYFVPNFNNPTMGPAFKQHYVRQALQETLNQPLIVTRPSQGYGYAATSAPCRSSPTNKWLSPAAKQGTPYPFSTGEAKSLLDRPRLDATRAG